MIKNTQKKLLVWNQLLMHSQTNILGQTLAGHLQMMFEGGGLCHRPLIPGHNVVLDRIRIPCLKQNKHHTVTSDAIDLLI